jgi:hypothetical protein
MRRLPSSRSLHAREVSLALCVLAALAAVVVPMGLAPSALAAGETGQISGTVTEASTQAPIEGITVCASPREGPSGRCEATNSDGEYTVSMLAPGAYSVQFFVRHGTEGELDYASQYYNGKPHRSEAEPVSVAAGATTSGVDAVMLPGGKITGVVTDAVTQAPLEGIQACTLGIEEPDVGRCGNTNANGEYTLSPLTPGEYVVVFQTSSFEAFPDYASQDYDGQMSERDATKVAVTAGGTTSGIDAAMQLGGIITGRVTAAATQDPIAGLRVCGWLISDESAERCPETNANGEYTLTHLRAGATAVEFGTPFSSNLGYVTEFYSGKASLAEATPLAVTPGVTITGIDATLHAVGEVKEEKIEPPHSTETTLSTDLASATPLVAKTPVVTLMGSRLKVSGGSAPVSVECNEATCQGSIELVVQVAAKRRKGKTATARKETLVLATGSFSLAEDDDGSVLLRLTSVGRQKLAHARRRPIVAKLILSVKGGETTTTPVLTV